MSGHCNVLLETSSTRTKQTSKCALRFCSHERHLTSLSAVAEAVCYSWLMKATHFESHIPERRSEGNPHESS